MGRSLTPWAAPVRIGAASLCGLAVAVGAGSLRAQEGGAGGKTLTFGLSQRFEADSNYALDSESDSDGATYIASTDLSLDFRSATRGQTLDLGLGGALRRIDAPDEDDSESFGFYDPDYSLAYTRLGPGSSLSLDAFLRSSEISFLRRLDSFVDDEGALVIPDDIDDLEDLEGTGTRQTLGYGASLALWQDTRFGVTARARMRDTSYEDTSDPGLFDERSTVVGVETRMELTEIHTLTTDLRYTWIENEDPLDDDDGGPGLDTTLAVARPGGALTATLGVDETDEGTRLSLQGGIVRERPLGGIGLSLGVSRGGDGDLGLIGSIDYTRAFPTGQISLQAEQTFAADDDDEAVTAVVARYGRELNALTSMSANASFASTTDSVTDETTSDLSLGLSLSRRLDPDWAVTAGVNAIFFQDEGEDDWERSENVYVTLGRSFDWRF